MGRGLVAIVGRPNVGKSSLFNRLIGKRIAIVAPWPGVTRDRIYADTSWGGRRFSIIDTGGLDIDEEDALISRVREQIMLAVEEADLLLFVVDAKEGLTATDFEIAQLLREKARGKPVVLVANKCDGVRREEVFSFYELGFEEIVPVSAIHGLNINTLLDKIVEKLPPEEGEVKEEVLKIAFVGRPNVGKSSLVNALLGEERMIVHEMPGTTRDAVDISFEWDGQKILLIDTAGVRRKSRIRRKLEQFSVAKAISTIRRTNIALLVIDAVEGPTLQDCKIAHLIEKEGKGCIILVNKWDLILERTRGSKEETLIQDYMRLLRLRISFMDYAPIIFVSALTGQRVDEIMRMVKQVEAQWNMRVATASAADDLDCIT